MINWRKYRPLLLIIALMMAASGAYAQRTTLKGYVYDAKTGQPVPFATVAIHQTSSGVTSDKDGYYHLEGIMAGELIVEVRCVGFQTVTELMFLEEDQPMVHNFVLEASSHELKEVMVTSDKDYQREQITISEIRIQPAQIEQTPSIGGMADVIQHIQVVPGVVSRGDIGGQIYIRGGTPVQNRMMLDETVVYNPVHSIGLFTVFDNDYIRDVDLHTGGFGAEYGGAISSVIQLTTRYGNTRNLSGKADLSTIASKIFLEGPLLKDSSMEGTNLSILFSVKNSHFDRASDWFYPYLEQELPFHFLDIYSKLTLHAGKSLRMNVYAFNNRDRVGYTGSPATYSWISNGFGGDIQLMPPRSSMLIKAYFAGSFYRMNLEEQSYDPRYSDVSHLSFGFRFKRYMKNQTILYGLEIMNLTTDYEYFTTPYNAFEQRENSTEVSGYIQYHVRAGRFMIDPGLRLQYYATLSKSSLEPRLAIKYSPLEHFRMKVAGGFYSQNLISAISDRDIINFFHGFLSAPVDLVNQGNEDLSNYYLQKAQHYIFGLEADFSDQFFFNMEVYYKYFPQLINFNKNKLLNPEDYPDVPDYLTGDFIVESGFAKGLDFSAIYQGNYKKLEVGYSYAITQRIYDDPVLGRTQYYPQYDRRHNLNLSGSIRFGKLYRWEVNARWNYGTGFPFTPTQGYYEAIPFDENAVINHLTGNGQMGIAYGEYNSARLPAFHRLDASILKKFEISPRTSLEAEFTVINLYNKENVFYTDRRTNEQIYQLPILPSLRVGVAF